MMVRPQVNGSAKSHINAAHDAIDDINNIGSQVFPERPPFKITQITATVSDHNSGEKAINKQLNEERKAAIAEEDARRGTVTEFHEIVQTFCWNHKYEPHHTITPSYHHPLQ
jgi:hypothetical protein